MSKDWYQQSINALQLNGKGERTQQAYTRALRMLVDFTGKRAHRTCAHIASRSFAPGRQVCYCPARACASFSALRTA